MKKILHKGFLSDVQGFSSQSGQIIAYRYGKQIHLNNFEALPADSFTLAFDEKAGEFVIRVRMNDGEFLVIQDATGVAEKKVVDGF
jgi:hypothetical protein